MTDQHAPDATTTVEPASTDGADADAPSEAGRDAAEGIFTEAIAGFQWIPAVLVGAGTLLGAYGLMALLFVVGPGSVGGTADDRFVRFGFILYNSHNVPLEFASQGFVVPGSFTSNLLTGADGDALPTIVYYAVPVAALFVAGVLFEWRRTDRGAEGFFEGATLAGMGLATGYVAVALVGTRVFVSRTTSGNAWASVRPALLESFVFFAAYALAFATVGALAVRGWRRYA